MIAIASITSNYIFIKENITENSKVLFEDITTTLEHITQKDKNLMEGLIDELKKDSKSIELFTLKKELIAPEDFEKWKSKNHRNRYYFSMDSYYIIDSTIINIG